MRARTFFAIVCGLGLGAAVTKPRVSTFDAFFQKWMEKKLSEADEGSQTTNIVRWFNNRIGSLASSLTSALSQVRVVPLPRSDAWLRRNVRGQSWTQRKYVTLTHALHIDLVHKRAFFTGTIRTLSGVCYR